ncbi:MAG: FIST N-terminal domain-containing protein [Campylobacterota bacterium]|nr:FIST N-terminal domain-containing protein [Campylobacterota bacterium]
MKSLSTYYENAVQLENFVTSEHLKNSSSLLIQVFTASLDKAYIKTLLEALQALLPQAKVIGSTTDGEICNGKVSTQKTVLSFTQFENTKLKVAITTHQDSGYLSGEKLAKTLLTQESKLLIAFGDGLSTNGEAFLNGINAVDSKIIVAGGLAGDNANFSNTYVFNHEEILTNAAVAVVFDNQDLHVNTHYSFNWKRIGIELSISKVKENRVYRIGERSALETYAHYLGKDIADNLPDIGIEFPLIIERDGINIARAATAKYDDGSVGFAGSFKEGDRVHFGYGDAKSILNYTQTMLDSIHEKPSQALFVYSCMARRHFMGDAIESEILPLARMAPVSGFFTHGEFFTAEKKEFLNQSMTILSLSESDTITPIKSNEVSVASLQSSSVNALAHLVDVTSREVEKQKDAFETLFEKSSDGILILENNIFVQCNEKIVSMLGYASKEAVLRLHPSKLSPEFQPDGRSSFEKAEEMMRIATTEGRHLFEWVHTYANGENFWAEIVLTPIVMIDRDVIHVVWRDISERKQMEVEIQNYTTELESSVQKLEHQSHELKRQENYLKKSQEIAHIGVWDYDLQNDRLYWSDEVYRIFGYEPQSFTPTYSDFLAHVHPDDRDALDEVYSQSLSDKCNYNFSHRIIRSDKSLRYVEERGEHTFDRHGEVIKTVGIILDTTDRKELELMLVSLNKNLDKRVKEEIEKNRLQEQQLFQHSRMAQMGEMISMIAHQWQQPLGSIASTTVNLQTKIELESFDLSTKAGQSLCNEYMMQRLENINKYVFNLTSTIDDFRNFYKPNKQVISIHLRDLISKSLNIIKASLENDNIELIENYHDTHPVEIFDSEMMQVVLNLLKNAQDNFKEKKIKNPWIKISTQDRSFSICDNGGGIPENILANIFDPYFSTKDAKNGTGLGLYMSKIIIEEHHKGSLHVNNTNDGVCFKIKFKKGIK